MWFPKERPWRWRPAIIIEHECRWAWSIIPYPYMDWSEDADREVRVWSLGKVGIQRTRTLGGCLYDFDSFGVAYRFGPWTLKFAIAADDD